MRPLKIKDWRDPGKYDPVRLYWQKAVIAPWPDIGDDGNLKYDDGKPLKEIERQWAPLPKIWAWEFLRRNVRYQREWEAALDLWRSRGCPTSNVGTMTADPSEHFFHLPFTRNQARDHWGLGSGYANPLTDRPLFLSFEPPWGTDYDFAPEKVGPPRCYWVFDLSRPLKPQLQMAERELRHEQEYRKGTGDLQVKRNTPHTGKFSHYLRLLDARAEGLTYTEIADRIDEDPHPKKGTPPEDAVLDEVKVRQRLKAALRLTEPEGYFSILFGPA